MVGFDNSWYAGIIERFTPESVPGTEEPPTANSIDAHGRCLLVAACIIAQAIDGLAEAIKTAAKEITPPL